LEFSIMGAVSAVDTSSLRIWLCNVPWTRTLSKLVPQCAERTRVSAETPEIESHSCKTASLTHETKFVRDVFTSRVKSGRQNPRGLTNCFNKAAEICMNWWQRESSPAEGRAPQRGTRTRSCVLHRWCLERNLAEGRAHPSGSSFLARTPKMPVTQL